MRFSATDDATTYGVVAEIVIRALKSGAMIIAAREDDVPGKEPLAAILRCAI